MDLKNADFCALTTDGWTPKSIPESYVTYTCNYVDSKTGQLKSQVLETAPFGDSAHTGECIEEKLKETLQAFKIEGN